MNSLTEYRKQALKLANIKLLSGDEGYVATIPGFRGLLAVGRNKKEAIAELDTALEDWMDFVIRRGVGLPRLVKKQKRELISA